MACSEMSSETELHFEVDAALLFELGEKLVAKKSIALAELVKNAYDADATTVTVTLDDVREPGGTITVSDNGHGMSMAAIRKGWMRIATDDKVRNPISPHFGRPRTGEKGVGRFATRRLANYLTLTSRARVSETEWEEVLAVFDWGSYEAGTDLDQIPCKVQYRRTKDSLPTGVTLVMEDVRDHWAERDIREVQKDMLTLTPPFSSIGPAEEPEGVERDPGFDVVVVAEEFDIREQQVSDFFLEAAVGQLKGRVSENGHPSYWYVGRSGHEEQITLDSESLPDVVGASMTVYQFVYSSRLFRTFDFGVRVARSIGRDYGGLRVYQDGFRLFPYGDPGNDWLSLDEDRAGRLVSPPEVLKRLFEEDVLSARPMLLLPGNNQLFGGVFTSRHKHPNLIPVLNREGLLANEAFEQLKRFVRLGIDWMTLQRAKDQAGKVSRPDRERDGGPKKASEVVDEALSEIAKIVQEELAPELRSTVLSQLHMVRDAVKAQEEDHIGKVGMLRVLASAGTMVLIFSHQIRALIEELRRVAKTIEEIALDTGGVLSGRLGQAEQRLLGWIHTVEAQAEQVGFLLGSESRGQRQALVVHPIVDHLIDVTKNYCDGHGIVMENNVPKGIRTTRMFEAEVHSVLLNLVTNAIKAVSESSTRRIGFFAEDDGEWLTIRVQDTGYGIAEEQKEKVFEPFFTTSPPDPFLGVGTGLGLTIVRDVILEYGGKVRFGPPSENWVTCVEVVLPSPLRER